MEKLRYIKPIECGTVVLSQQHNPPQFIVEKYYHVGDCKTALARWIEAITEHSQQLA